MLSRRLNVLLFDTNKATRNAYIMEAIRRALQAHPSVGTVRFAGYGEACGIARTDGIDVFIAVGGAGGDSLVVTRLARMCPISVLWTTEDPYEIDANFQLANAFDLVFTNDKDCVPLYRQAEHLPLAACRHLHDLPVIGNDSDFLYDVLFVGSAWPNRVQQIRNVISLCGDHLKYKIALPTNPFLPTPKIGDRRWLIDWRLSPEQLAAMANRSRITLSLMRAFSANQQSLECGTTPPPRVFENAAAGAFQIVVAASPELGDYFQPGVEVAAVDTVPDAAAAIRRYLDAPDERFRMATQAKARAMAEHTYDARVDVILRAVSPLAERTSVVRDPVTRGRRKRILHLTHNVRRNGGFGGVEVYQEVLASRLADVDSYFLYSKRTDGRCFLVVETLSGYTSKYEVNPVDPLRTLHDPSHESAFSRILVKYQIDLVHIHHLIGHVLSLPIIARAMGVPTVLTMHDYYAVCSKWTMIGYEGRYCGIDSPDTTLCDICLNASDGVVKGSQGRRRHFWNLLLRSIDLVLASTESSARKLLNVYPTIPPEKVVIAGIGNEMDDSLSAADRKGTGLTAAEAGHRLSRAEESGHRPLSVAIIGNFTVPKGADILLRLFNILQDEPIHFHIYGRIESQGHQDVIDALRLPNLTCVGLYDVSRLHQMILGHDVSLHLSIWPETFCFTLSEAWAAGLVPIVTDLGALGDRVRDGENGFKVPLQETWRVADILRRLTYDRGLLARMRLRIRAEDHRTMDRHLTVLNRIYGQLLSGLPLHHFERDQHAKLRFDLCLRDCGIVINAPDWTRPDVEWDQPTTVVLDDDDGFDEVTPSPGLNVTMPELSAYAQPEVTHVIDEVNGTGTWEVRDGVVLHRIDWGESLRLHGWIVDEAVRAGPAEGFVWLRGPTNRYIPLILRPRPDVGLHRQLSGDVGFSLRVGMEDVPYGAYQILFTVRRGRRVFDYPSRHVLVHGVVSDADVDRMIRSVGTGLAVPLVRDPVDKSADDVHVDSIDGDAATGSEIVRLPAVREVAMIGWVLDPVRRHAFERVQVRLGAGSTAWYVDAVSYPRPDVMAIKGDQAALWCGFKAQIPVHALPAGRYELSVIGTAFGKGYALPTGKALVLTGAGDAEAAAASAAEAVVAPVAEPAVQPVVAEAAAEAVAAPVPDVMTDVLDRIETEVPPPAPVAIAVHETRDDRQGYSIDAIGDVGQPSQGNVTVPSGADTIIRGWFVDAATRRSFSRVQIWLTGETSTHVAEAQAVIRPDVAEVFGVPAFLSGGFAATLSPGGVPAGSYELSLVGEVDGHGVRAMTGLLMEIPLTSLQDDQSGSDSHL